MKLCKSCLIDQPLSNFHKSCCYCKTCKKSIYKETRERRTAPEGWVPNIEYMRDNFSYDKSGCLISKTGRMVRGSKKNNGYLNVVIRYRNFMMHRLVWIWHYGECPSTIDHINNIRDDNRIENLQESTTEFNVRKCLKRIANTSGFIGVSYSSLYGKFEAKISIKGKTIHAGKFKSIRTAIMSYNRLAIELHGEAGQFKADQNIAEMKRRGWV